MQLHTLFFGTITLFCLPRKISYALFVRLDDVELDGHRFGSRHHTRLVRRFSPAPAPRSTLGSGKLSFQVCFENVDLHVSW